MSDEAWNRWFTSSMLTRNHAVLAELEPRLARRILTTPLHRPDVTPELLESGLPSARVLHQMQPRSLYRGPDPVAEAEAELERQLVPGAPAVLLAGVGLGYYLEAILRKLPPDVPVWAFDPDPLWLCLTLSRIDLVEPMIAGRLRFAEGLALEELVAALPMGTALVMHRGLEPRIRWDVDTVHRAAVRLKGPGAVVWNASATDTTPTAADTGPTERAGDAGPTERAGDAGPTASAADSARIETCAPTYRICLVQGTLFFEDLAAALRQRGDDVLILHPTRLSAEEVLEELARARADLVLSVDQVDGLAELCARARVPYAVWEVNPRMWVAQPPPPDDRAWVHLFTYRKAHVARYLEYGFRHVDHLPLAATPAWRRPLELTDDERARYAAPVSFVGASLVLDQQRDLRRAENAIRARVQACTTVADRDRWTMALRILREALGAQQEDLLRPVLIEQLERGWGELGLTPELEAEGRLIDLRIIYARMFGTRRRCMVLSSLADYGVAVYGDPEWRSVLDPRVQFRGAAEHGEELTRIYNASSINLDIGRLYQLDIVTMRVFDILACGGFALVEHSDELEALLEPGREVVAWRDLNDLREVTGYYLAHPEARRACIEAGRARVLREHTVDLRVERILETLRARGALRT